MLLTQEDCSSILLQSLYETRFEVTDTISCNFQPDTSLLCESELLGDLETFDYVVTVGTNSLTSIDEIDGVNVRDYGRIVCDKYNDIDMSCFRCGDVALFEPLFGSELNVSQLALRIIDEVSNAASQPTPSPNPPVIVPEVIIDGRTIFSITGLILGIVSLLVLFVSRVNNEFEIQQPPPGINSAGNTSTVGLLIESNPTSNFSMTLSRILSYEIPQIRERRSASDMEKVVSAYKSADITPEVDALNRIRESIGINQIKFLQSDLQVAIDYHPSLPDAIEQFINFICLDFQPKGINLKRISRRARPTKAVESYLVDLFEGLNSWLQNSEVEHIDQHVLGVFVYSYIILQKIKIRYEIRTKIDHFIAFFGAIAFVCARVLIDTAPITLRYWANISNIPIETLYEFETQFHKDSGIIFKSELDDITTVVDKINFQYQEDASL